MSVVGLHKKSEPPYAPGVNEYANKDEDAHLPPAVIFHRYCQQYQKRGYKIQAVAKSKLFKTCVEVG